MVSSGFSGNGANGAKAERRHEKEIFIATVQFVTQTANNDILLANISNPSIYKTETYLHLMLAVIEKIDHTTHKE